MSYVLCFPHIMKSEVLFCWTLPACKQPFLFLHAKMFFSDFTKSHSKYYTSIFTSCGVLIWFNFNVVSR